MFRTALAIGLLLTAPGVRTPSAQSTELAGLLQRLADRTQDYYDRFISIICTETVRQQELRFNLTPVGRPRVTVYELSVSRDPHSKDEKDFRVGRVLQTVNGRPAAANQQPECTDPKTGTPEPLAFLLAKNQARYRFMPADAASGGPAGARAMDFVETPPERVQVTWKGRCFEAEGGGYRGRLWFDPATFDVLEVELRLSKPFRVPPPSGSFGLQLAIGVERSQSTMRFARVRFEEPDETVLLPASIDTTTVFRGAPSHRTVQTLSGFRRFLSEWSIR